MGLLSLHSLYANRCCVPGSLVCAEIAQGGLLPGMCPVFALDKKSQLSSLRAPQDSEQYSACGPGRPQCSTRVECCKRHSSHKTASVMVRYRGTIVNYAWMDGL